MYGELSLIRYATDFMKPDTETYNWVIQAYTRADSYDRSVCCVCMVHNRHKATLLLDNLCFSLFRVVPQFFLTKYTRPFDDKIYIMLKHTISSCFIHITH